MSAATWQAFQGSRVGGGFDHTAHITGSMGTMNSPLPPTTIFRTEDLPQKSLISQGKAPQLPPDCRLHPSISASSSSGLAGTSRRTLLMGASCAINITLTSTSSGATAGAAAADHPMAPYTTRHHSEPNLPLSSFASTSSGFTLNRSLSVYHVPFSHIDEDMSSDVTTNCLPVESPTFQRRTPSPTPTEIIQDIDPTVEEAQVALETHGIKVRDFAYAPPPKERVAEFFDPIYALSEYEYRLSLSPRTVPVPGKTLRRLLDLNWVTQEEASERWCAMDWEQLEAYDAVPAHPYALPKSLIPIPSRQERDELVKPYLHHQKAIARSYVNEQKFQEYLRHEQMEIEMSQEICRKREEEEERRKRVKEEKSPRKRSLQQASSFSSLLGSASQPEPHKRLRLSPPPESHSFSQPLAGPSSYRYSSIQQQFPAPLSSYDPKRYPLVHTQYPQHSTPPIEEVLTPVDTSAPPEPSRSDTPPLDEVRETQATQDVSASQSQLPQASQQRRGLGRTLNRTETFSQL